MKFPIISNLLNNMAAERMADRLVSAVNSGREFLSSGNLDQKQFAQLDGSIVAAANQKLFHRLDFDTFSIVSSFISKFHPAQMASISDEQVTIVAKSSTKNLSRILSATKDHPELRATLKPEIVSAGVHRTLQYEFSDSFSHARLHTIESSIENDPALREAYISTINKFCVSEISTGSKENYGRVSKLFEDSHSEEMHDELAALLRPVVADHADKLVDSGAFTHLINMMEVMQDTHLADDVSSAAIRFTGESLIAAGKNKEFARLVNVQNRIVVPDIFSAAQVAAVGQALFEGGDVAGFDTYINGLKNVHDSSKHHLHHTHRLLAVSSDLTVIFNYETRSQLLCSEINGLSATSLEQAEREWTTEGAREVFKQFASVTQKLAQGGNPGSWYGGVIIPDIVREISSSQMKSLKLENV